jgi:hypothetical protein
MSKIRATDGRAQAIAGGAIIVIISVLAAVLVIAGVIYAAGTGERHQAALAAAGCEPNLSPSGLPCTTAAMLTRQYLAITAPAAQQIKTGMAAYAAGEGHARAAAAAALAAQVAVENALDTSLARFPFPPAVAPVASKLIQADRARAALTAQQARAPSLTRMRSYNHRITAADVTVRTDLKLTLNALETPPAASQEP